MGLFWLLVLSVAYFLPSINAYFFTKHPKRSMILAINLLFGWSVIGWVIALAWSYTKQS